MRVSLLGTAGWTVCFRQNLLDLLFANELALHAWIFSTGSSARIWSVLCCVQPDQAGKNISTEKPKVLCFSRRPRQCTGCLPDKKAGLIQIFTPKFTLGLIFGDVLFWYIKKWSCKLKIKRFLSKQKLRKTSK